MDEANANVTKMLPAILDVIMIGVILRVIDTLKLFDLVYVTTRGARAMRPSLSPVLPTGRTSDFSKSDTARPLR